jgi:putative membrane protein
MRALLSHLFVGITMGMADLVPGVSGGTIAFVSGRYERLVAAIHSVDREGVGLLLRGRWGALARHVDLPLLGPLLLGIAIAVVTLSGVLDHWLEDVVARPRLFAFFVGLVLASILIVGRRISWSARHLALGAAGTAVGLVVAFAAPARTPETAPWALLGGALAICAMILPGISGSFILLLVGQYERAVEAIDERSFGTIGLFAIGAIVGLLVFVRVLRWLLDHWHDDVVAVLVGFIAGSVPRLWPWTSCIECAEPALVGPTGNIVLAIGLAVAGAAAILGFERWATRGAAA